MSHIVALDRLIDTRQVWRGQSANLAPSSQSTGHAALDAALPTGGWPEAALSELLLPANGVGELELLWPALARLSQDDALHGGRMIALVDPPFVPYAPAWRDAGVAPARLQWIRAQHRDALWAAEQCLRSGACAAVLCWPQRADDRALRRLQVAAETGQCLGFALRDSRAALNPSPAALRIAIDTAPRQLRVLKCRGGNAPARPIAFAHGAHNGIADAAVSTRIETIRNESEPGRNEPAILPSIRLAAQPSRGGRLDLARHEPSPAPHPAPVLTLRPR